MEIVRRYFADRRGHLKRTGTGEEQVERLALHDEPGRRDPGPFAGPRRGRLRRSATGGPGWRHGAARRPRGHRQDRRSAGRGVSALLMNALKAVTGVDDEPCPVIDDAAIEPICRLKTEHLRQRATRRLHSDETLIALSIT